MGSVPVENSGLFRGFPNVLGFSCAPDVSPSSLVLNEEKKALVRAPSKLQAKKEAGGVLDAKTAMAMKIHSEAERRRRERINGHLALLRRMVPCADKLDKATLLAEVINHVKKLKRNAIEISKDYTIPSDVDEVRVEIDRNITSPGKFVVKASLCCEDRPDILPNLRQTLISLHLNTIRAEISTLGGRIKNVLVMTSEGNARHVDKHLFVASVHQALKTILDRVNSQIDFLPRNSFSNKRQKIDLASS
ncbi:hypothetical protein Cni_G05897 [Canna indica]|uniref:BHLH domain-containing protein n=1 Tax=Canna indica TaxID=4628 RepID=A0AAQ3JVJ8_9LILI|nr:hypothetical protein Cni_G05897 [Canna indica]